MARRLTQLEGFVAEGDVFAIDWAVAEGRFPTLVNEAGWPTPTGFHFGFGSEQVVLTDQLQVFKPGIAFLRPPSLVAGIHPGPHATAEQIEDLLIDTLAKASLARSSVSTISTADHTRNDRSVRLLGYPIRAFPAHELDRVNVPNPSGKLRAIVGTQSVCEASALLAAGRNATLIVARTRSAVGTIAIARRHTPREIIIDLTQTTPIRTSNLIDKT